MNGRPADYAGRAALASVAELRELLKRLPAQAVAQRWAIERELRRRGERAS